MTIFTIGYEGLDINEFLSLLRIHDIDCVVDVREVPISRKPGFSKKGLASTLNQFGFDYVHRVRLGCPKSIRSRYHIDHNWRRYSKDFYEYLQTQHEAVAELVVMSEHANCALLCYESNPSFCHRSLVAEEVKTLAGDLCISHIRSTELKTEVSPGSLRATV